MTPHPGTIVQCALDGCEGTWEWKTMRGHRKYCSKSCTDLASSLIRSRTRESAVCLRCGGEYLRRPQDGQRFCSNSCSAKTTADRQRALRAAGVPGRRSLETLHDNSPWEWDGQTVCLACSTVAGPWLLTEDRYRKLVKAQWLPDGERFRPARCERCNGWLILEPTDSGNLNSPTRGSQWHRADTYDWGQAPLTGVA